MLLLYYLLNWIFYKVGRFHKIVYIEKSHFLIISNGDFSAPVWPTVHTHSVKTVTENASFQKRSLERRFLKTLLLVYVWTDENGDFSNTMMS